MSTWRSSRDGDGDASRASLRVKRVTGLVTVQDAGRPGWMARGIPPGGPLAPSRFHEANLFAANRIAGAGPSAAAVEVVGQLEVEAEGATILIGVDGEGPTALEPGAVYTLRSTAERRVRYLAVHGGIDVPTVFGGKGTLLVASLGGCEGRTLRAGDRLRSLESPSARLRLGTGDADGAPHSETRPMVQAADSNEDDRPRVRVVLGPDLEDFEDVALGVLLENEFSVSPQADRVGTRLVGPRLLRKVALAAARRPSMPMVRGAIQVPPDGQPIVLGPDHPTTGGYPLIGVVVSADVEKVVAAPVGRVLRFARALPA